jgi:hypothetical protein
VSLQSSCNKIALSLIDGQTVVFAIKCNVKDMLFVNGILVAMLVIAPLLLVVLSFLSVQQ